MTTPTPTSPACAECDHECIRLTYKVKPPFMIEDTCCNCRGYEHERQCQDCQNVNEAAYEHATTPAYGNGDR